MEKRKLRKLVSTRYKFECIAISHKGKYLVQYETVGFIVLERRSKENALKEDYALSSHNIHTLVTISEFN